MDKKWKEDIIRTSRRETDDEWNEFIMLVDMAAGKCDRDTIRVLMKTYRDFDDFGSQEAVESVLSSAEPRDLVISVLEELPRLIIEAPEWAAVLIGQHVHRRPDLVSEIAKSMPDDVKQSLRTLLSDTAFTDFYPNADRVHFE